MKFIYKALFSFIILAILIFGLYFFTDWFSKVTGYLSGEDERTILARCLNEQGVEFYSGSYCSECDKQTAIFGSAISLITKIDCITDNKGNLIDERCSSLRSVPAWYINGTIIYGLKSIKELQSLPSCEDK